MEVMRKFIIDLKPDGTMKWAEVCDELTPEIQAYKRIINYCKTMSYIENGNEDKVSAYYNVIHRCRQMANLW